MIFCPENFLVKFVFSFHLQTVDGLILEMPTDKQDAYRMLSRLSGKERSVFTGVAIVLCHDRSSATDYKVVDFYEETKVKFAELSEEILTDLSVLDRDMAGVYGIQTLGGMLVEYVRGDFLNLSDIHARTECDCVKCSRQDLPHSIINFIHITFASKLKVFDVLNIAVSLGLLERVKQQNTSVYRNTEQRLHGYILQCNDMVWPLFSHLENAVREGTNEFKKRLMDAMPSITRLTGKNVATAFDPSPYKTACDIGADLYILARILHDWSDEKLHVLLSILSKMCTPGKKRPSRALLQALSMTEGKQRITTEYRDLLEKHGFTAKHIKHADNLLDAMLFLKEDPNDKRTLLGCSSASIETAELE
uniref:Acetylserotonin O-methyltransferase-like n=1 Tax=Cyprinus carpio TaxID=7962 RepID=A0A8C1WKS2_CYPCA